MDFEEDKHQAMPGDFDPLLIGILGCFAGVFMVAGYHFVTTRYTSHAKGSADSDNDREGNRPDSWPSTSAGHAARLPSYLHPGPGKLDGTCAVCLSDYGDGEMIRVLPECSHSFHAPCIDMWLYSHSSCLLCRANTRLLPSPLSRRLAQSGRRSTGGRLPRDSTPATRLEGDNTSPRHVTVLMPSLDEEDPAPRSPSASDQVVQSTQPGHLAMSTSHSDQETLPAPSPNPTTVRYSPI